MNQKRRSVNNLELEIPYEVLRADKSSLIRTVKNYIRDNWCGRKLPGILITNDAEFCITLLRSRDYNDSDGTVKGMVLLIDDKGETRVLP